METESLSLKACVHPCWYYAVSLPRTCVNALPPVENTFVAQTRPCGIPFQPQSSTIRRTHCHADSARSTDSAHDSPRRSLLGPFVCAVYCDAVEYDAPECRLVRCNAGAPAARAEQGVQFHRAVGQRDKLGRRRKRTHRRLQQKVHAYQASPESMSRSTLPTVGAWMRCSGASCGWATAGTAFMVQHVWPSDTPDLMDTG
jgi:hypothetical protein